MAFMTCSMREKVVRIVNRGPFKIIVRSSTSFRRTDILVTVPFTVFASLNYDIQYFKRPKRRRVALFRGSQITNLGRQAGEADIGTYMSSLYTADNSTLGELSAVR